MESKTNGVNRFELDFNFAPSCLHSFAFLNFWWRFWLIKPRFLSKSFLNIESFFVLSVRTYLSLSLIRSPK